MTERWLLKPHDSDRVMALSRASGLPPIVAHLLINRGVSNAEQARIFLGARRDSLHDPELLPGVVEAADRIVRAIRAGRKIVVYGDYDVDGACGTSVLWTCLKLAGAIDSEFYIPHRVDEGYGVNGDALRKIVARGASMIVTVDCGVSAVREADLARELGVEFIITDHHMPGPVWPGADALVHPQAPGQAPYPFAELCGAAVAFKLAWQICKSFGDGKKASPHLRNFLLSAFNLVALATVADVMPLEGENRIFVRHGLRGLLADDAPIGLKALLQVSGLLNKGRLTSTNLAYGLAPRINAAGRLKRAQTAVQMLTSEDPVEALELAQALDDCNRERQELERRIVAQAREMVEKDGGLGEKGAIVVGHKDWHPGVIGIVASRLVDAYHRPAIVASLGDELATASARSVEGFHLHDALSACSESLISFGGHRAAAGLKIAPANFPAFAERFDLHCRAALTEEMRTKVIRLDAEVPLGLLTHAVVEAIEQMEPFGQGNPKPMLLAERVQLVGQPKFVGEKKNHVQMRFGQGDVVLKAVGWNMATRVADLKPGTPCAIVFSPSINEWNDRREVQLELKDFRVATRQSQDNLHASARPA